MQFKHLVLFISLMICSALVFGQTNNKVEIGGHASFKSKYKGNYTYQWKEDCNDGHGYHPISGTGYTDYDKQLLQIPGIKAEMNGYRYRCVVKDEHNNEIQDDNADTLTVTTSITGSDNFIVDSDKVILKSTATNGTFQWQLDEGFGFRDLIGRKADTLNLGVASCSLDHNIYRCKVSGGGQDILSNPDTLIITGCILPSYTINSLGSSAVFIVSSKGKDLTYQWKVKPRNSGKDFIDITVNDTDLYKGYQTDTLKIIRTTEALNGSLYQCTITNWRKIPYTSQTTELRISGNISRVDNNNRFSLTGAFYSSISGLKDDNSASLTQFYLRANIYRKTEGVDINATCKRWVWLRNFFLQVTYTTNADNIIYFNTSDSARVKSFTHQDTALFRSVNRLDLVKNATVNINFMTPILTYLYRSHKPHYGDMAHIYLDPFAALLITNVNGFKDTTTPIRVFSMQYGINLGIRSEDLRLFKNQLFIEVQTKMFWLDVLSDRVNPNLNYQQGSVSDYIKNKSKKLTTNANLPMYNLDGLLMYNTSQSSNSNVFLHFSFFTNLLGGSSIYVYNNYWQLQGGYSLDINALFAKLTKKS